MESLTAYVDDSTSQDERVFCLAGYIAPDRVWLERFTPEWRKLIRLAPGIIREFKTSNCRSGGGEFKGWAEDDRHALIDRAVDVVVDSVPESDMVGFAFCVAAPPGMRPAPKWIREWQEATFQFALHSVMFGLIRYSGWLDKGMSLSLVIDQKKGFTKFIQPAWRRVQQAFSSDTARIVLKPPREAESHEEAPLQAADLLANLTSREAFRRLEGIAVEKALARLVRGRFHAATCHNYDDLAEASARYRESGVLPFTDDLDHLFRTDESIRSPRMWPMSRPGLGEIARRVATRAMGSAAQETGGNETT